MTVKEFYDTIPSTVKNLLSSINTNIMASVWTGTGTGISATDLTQMNNKVWLSMFNRELSFMVEGCCDMNSLDPATLTSSTMANLIKFLFLPYKDKWTRLWENVYLQDYNPIWNYDGTNSTTRTFEHGKQVLETRNMTDTHNKGVTDTTTVISDTIDNTRRGFNSSSNVNTEGSTHTGSSTVASSGNDSDVMTGTDTFKNSGVDTERITETKGGNQGTTTTQYMLNEEIALRKKFKYFDIVIQDIVNEFSLKIYI